MVAKGKCLKDHFQWKYQHERIKHWHVFESSKVWNNLKILQKSMREKLYFKTIRV